MDCQIHSTRSRDTIPSILLAASETYELKGDFTDQYGNKGEISIKNSGFAIDSVKLDFVDLYEQSPTTLFVQASPDVVDVNVVSLKINGVVTNTNGVTFGKSGDGKYIATLPAGHQGKERAIKLRLTGLFGNTLETDEITITIPEGED